MKSCCGYCKRYDFSLVILGKTRRCWPYKNVKRCLKCEYITITNLWRCPCCNFKFRTRYGTNKFRTKLERELTITRY